jgi:hypothetical protein
VASAMPHDSAGNAPVREIGQRGADQKPAVITDAQRQAGRDGVRLEHEPAVAVPQCYREPLIEGCFLETVPQAETPDILCNCLLKMTSALGFGRRIALT